ncbi:serine serine/threonine-protein kinase Nek5 isoform X1 [Sigmodon hispidus]
MPSMDDYTVLKVIGQGSFGQVLLVLKENSNQKFAMKEVRLLKSYSDTQNSRKEAVLLAKMKHPNIVAFKESFEAEGHLYIVMEYCDGGDLMQKIRQQKGKLLPEDTILNWFIQICLGVNHIHKKRVLHRDIKSKNVFLTQSGKVKLGDFGSARLLSSPMAFACTYVGTPYYVPPEVWENLPYNNKSDIWSLGCILYELCALKHPFQANSWKNLILKICQGPIQPLPALYSYKLQSLVKHMLKRNPSQRPSATTLLCRGGLAPLVRKCLPPEVIREYGEQILDETKISEPKKKGGPGSPSEHQRKTTPASPHRQQWERPDPSSALAALEKAPILTSSFTAEDDRGGSVIKYSENHVRKKWLREPPETLLLMLKEADLSLAFQTYTIYRPGTEGFLKGPLSEETASDSVDGDDSVILDPERFEPRLDEEDTDFEEDDENPDWVSELKKKGKNEVTRRAWTMVCTLVPLGSTCMDGSKPLSGKPVEQEPLTPETMDKFDLIKTIGEGTFGKVYLAKNKIERNHCVIKEIDFTKKKSPGKEKEASKKEVILLAQMKHPNIVTFFSSFQENSRLFIVMEYCDGGDLMQRIQRQRGVLFSEDQILCWFVQISLGLRYIHDRHILHRDIKSQNIFLSKNGMVAKLGDFGTARELNNSMELAQTCAGTPYYLSPEICQNRPYNTKTDIWSLGCVLYELCTLRHPFESNNLHHLVLKICQARIAPISPHFSLDLQSLIPQLFKVSPEDRPSINSLLKMTFLETLVAQYLSPEVHSRRIQSHAHVKNEAIGLTTYWGGSPRSAAYLQRRFEAQQYKLKVERQLGLRPSSAEPHPNKREKLQSHKEDTKLQELRYRKNKMKDQEYWKQLEEIRQQYHSDMKEIKKRMDRELKRGVKFEICLDKCISEEDTVQENEALDKLNDTLSFENGMTSQESRPIKEHEDYTDSAFEELCGPEAEGFLKDVAIENRRQWDVRTPQTLLQIMATADVTSTCPTMSDDSQVIVMEGSPENGKQWWCDVPGTLSALTAACTCSSSLLATKGEAVVTTKSQHPKEDQEEAEIASGIVVDDEQLDPGLDDDIKFEESEDELRSEIIESLEKLATSTEERKEAPSSSKNAEKPGEKERVNLPV